MGSYVDMCCTMLVFPKVYLGLCTETFIFFVQIPVRRIFMLILNLLGTGSKKGRIKILKKSAKTEKFQIRMVFCRSPFQ
jgi:hypothetical protein